MRFETVSQCHIPLLFSWLNAPHVKGFYDEGYPSIHLVESKYLTELKGGGRFVVSEGESPFGYIQFYEIDRPLFSEERAVCWREHPIRLFNRYYLVHTHQTEFSRENLMQDEQEVILGYRWWSLEELLTTSEVVYPPLLGKQLQDVL